MRRALKTSLRSLVRFTLVVFVVDAHLNAETLSIHDKKDPSAVSSEKRKHAKLLQASILRDLSCDSNEVQERTRNLTIGVPRVRLLFPIV